MDDTTEHTGTAGNAGLSFATVSDAYDRARPSYPREAVDFLLGTQPCSVLEVGAGTGKFTDVLLDAGHDVTATDPLAEMLQHLRLRREDCPTAVASAEDLPVATRSVDAVVAAQAFHWFDSQTALSEMARTLKPEGVIGLVWNVRDRRIPWVRRLDALLGSVGDPLTDPDPTDTLVASKLFGFVESEQFRFWQSLNKPQLRDLISSRSYVAALDVDDRADLLHDVDALFDEYASGPEGVRMPYLTRCFRAVVRPVVLEDSGPIQLSGAGLMPPDPRHVPEDGGTHLFSFS
ncbi:MAG: class I SAM-dependent methyltransferase [Nocardioidaceae bacterium]